MIEFANIQFLGQNEGQDHREKTKMALKKCKECGHEVSTKADACPNCGAKLKTERKPIGCGGFIILVAAIGFVGSQFSDFTKSREIEKAAAQAQQVANQARSRASEEFEQKRTDIIKNIDELMRSGRYDAAKRRADPFKHINDPELQNRLSIIQNQLDKDEEEKLLSQVAKIPASQYRENLIIYKRLAGLNPESERYKAKVAHYNSKLEEERTAEEARAAAIRIKFGDKPKPSGWDGSYFEVERYLESVANDPGSIEIDNCTKPYFDDKSGWIVGCDYRGRNAFGGMIRNSNWFVIRHGKVVEMKAATAYKQ